MLLMKVLRSNSVHGKFLTLANKISSIIIYLTSHFHQKACDIYRLRYLEMVLAIISVGKRILIYFLAILLEKYSNLMDLVNGP